MTKKRSDRHMTEQQELQIDFDEAKELTVGQAMRKNEEVEAGVLPSDSILDKYVKQHKDEIEADKFATRQYNKEELVETQSLDDLIQEVRESVEDSEELATSEEVESSLLINENEEGMDPLVIEDKVLTDMTESLEEQNLSQMDQKGSRKKSFVVVVLALLSLIILAGAYYVYRQVSRSTNETQTSQATSTNQTDSEEFNNLYDSFYTDVNKIALKNSQFNKLSQLKTLLDKLEGSREYALSKSKYDSLESQIKAIQDVNAQFEKPAIVDGVLDTNAKAKSDAKFTDIKTGNTEIDKVLDKAVSLGKSQQTSSSNASAKESEASNQSSSTVAKETSSNSSSSTSSERRISRPEVNMGLSSVGVSLQRSASRVPYNQSAIEDTNNSAWDFTDGVLEQILATSRSRGYITGNQYILERVNIVNGNGYYNLFKPDGTYLFTLNCKTGYFVGNGSGHANDLDY